MDRTRDRRSPERERIRYQATPNSYHIVEDRAHRPRSRSPRSLHPRSRSQTRQVSDNWRGRPRSPQGRYDERIDPYSRETRTRSPRREYAPPETRYDSTMRPRSPPPAARSRPRSPPRRPYSPPGRPAYRPRSRSPRRDDRIDPYASKTWRRRSPSPRPIRPELRSGEGSGRDSVTTSRRSSPRGYNHKPIPELFEPEDFRVPPPGQVLPSRYRDDGNAYNSRPSRPTLEHEYSHNGNGYGPRDMEGPLPEHRAPPAAPRQPALSAPSGPSNSVPVSISAHSRPDSSNMAGVPSQPRGCLRGRGGGPPSRDWSSRDYGGPRRGGWENSNQYSSRGGPSLPRDPYPAREPSFDSRGPPPQHNPQHRNSGGHGFAGPSFRGSGNSTSTTYPRTQRFNQTLQDLPTVKEGGEKLPPLHDMTKADKLEEEAARLRKVIDERETKKRQGLREWDRLERESNTMALKSELAEEHLRSLNGEDEGIGAAF